MELIELKQKMLPLILLLRSIQMLLKFIQFVIERTPFTCNIVTG